MRNAWLHVEVLQTTDLPALMNHIADVFEAALELPKVIEALVKQGDLHQRQEVLVFYYLFGVLKHIEDIGEHRLVVQQFSLHTSHSYYHLQSSSNH